MSIILDMPLIEALEYIEDLRRIVKGVEPVERAPEPAAKRTTEEIKTKAERLKHMKYRKG